MIPTSAPSGAGQCLSKGFALRARRDQVTIQTDTYPEVFHGRIAYVAASLDPSTRTLQARIETNNPGEKLKKDMYVVATVSAGTIPNAIGLPDAAVLRILRTSRCLCRASANQFGRRSVTLGESLNGRRRLQRAKTRRPGRRKWQLVPAVCELAAALATSRKL